MLALACESRKPLTIDLTKAIDTYRHSTEKLQPGCTCYCCQNYTLGYLSHLFDVNEMNANILLGIHNSHAFD